MRILSYAFSNCFPHVSSTVTQTFAISQRFVSVQLDERFKELKESFDSSKEVLIAILDDYHKKNVETFREIKEIISELVPNLRDIQVCSSCLGTLVPSVTVPKHRMGRFFD